MGRPPKNALRNVPPFATWLIERMKRLGLDNRTMAKQTGTRVATIVHWRCGRRYPAGPKLYLLGLLLDTNELALRRLMGESRVAEAEAAKAKAELAAVGRIQAPSEVA